MRRLVLYILSIFLIFGFLSTSPAIGHGIKAVQSKVSVNEIRAKKTFKVVASVQLELGKGNWDVLVVGTATHENANFGFALFFDGKKIAKDERGWGSGTGHDWDVQSQQTLFRRIKGGQTYKVALLMRCFIGCRALNRRVMALAFPSLEQ